MKSVFQELLVKLRLLSMYYQTAHWTVKGSFFYQDHLLFERLYKSATESIDSVAEKAIGLTQDRSVVNLAALLEKTLEGAKKLRYECKENLEFVQEGIELEKSLLSFLESAAKECSLGCNDLMASIANKHEEHLYLLQQRLK
jgi:DNA-binding ferritin-like protein